MNDRGQGSGGRRSRRRKTGGKQRWMLAGGLAVGLFLALLLGIGYLGNEGKGLVDAEPAAAIVPEEALPREEAAGTALKIEAGAESEVAGAGAESEEAGVVLNIEDGAWPESKAAGAEELLEEILAADSEDAELEKQQAVASYEHLGIADVSGYLNIRSSADRNGEVIGMLTQNSACNILEEDGDWYRIASGEISGYVSRQYILTGDAAKERALENVKPRAVVTAQNVNIRTEPAINPENVTGQAFRNDRFEVLGQADGWIETEDGFLSSDYAEVRMALNEARELDLRKMALNQYENLVISKVNNYLNVRSTPEDLGNRNIIGQMTSKAAGEILEVLDGWYHIRSGNITGYISADPQFTATGQEARDLALESAELMAIVKTERLNVRMEPSTDSRIWTQISQEERYPVLEQLDGWVRIELDTVGENDETDGAYLSTRENNVEVRYALAEAIRFSPLEDGTSGGSSQSGASGSSGASGQSAPASQGGSLGTRVANYALQFVGNPYVWGGTSLTNGADCSGFVQSVMRNFGVSLPRTSREQARAGTEISSSQMLPGDLIFYANGSGTVNHVAMYIGNGQVVHASSRRTGIRISTWNYRTPKTIRRVL